jgi:hypothetical protein
MYTFFKDSFPEGRTGSLTGQNKHRPGDPRVAERHACHFCDFSPLAVCFLKKNENKT